MYDAVFHCNEASRGIADIDMRNQINAYCTEVSNYIYRLGLNQPTTQPTIWPPVPEPSPQLVQTPQISLLHYALNDLLAGRNDEVAKYLEASTPESVRRFYSYILVLAAFHLLALSFGLGTCRRIIDACQDRER
jgi:hypothetical protein